MRVFLAHLVIITVCFSNAAGASWQIYAPGLKAYETQDFDASANLFLALSNAPKTAHEDIPQDALAAVLATVSYEQADNPMAYTTWADSIRLFLSHGTSWETVQEILRDKLAAQKALQDNIIALDPVSTDAVAIDEEAVFLHRLLSKTALIEYQGPEPGLGSGKLADPHTDIQVARGYISRPIALADASERATVKGRLSSDYMQNADSGEDDDESDISTRGFQLDTAVSDELVLSEAAKNLPDKPEQAAAQSRDVLEKETSSITSKVVNEAPLFDQEDIIFDPIYSEKVGFRKPTSLPVSLSETEKAAAETAWSYFSMNYHAATGLFNSVHTYPYATFWDIGSMLAALICAHQLGVIGAPDFEKYINTYLVTLTQLPLYRDALPNREYQIKTGKMTDFKNRESDSGTGWSALDLGRVLIWLEILKQYYPEHQSAVDALIANWDLNRSVRKGVLYGAHYSARKGESLWQEGRLGYEQYAGMGYLLWGLPAVNTQSYEHIDTAMVLDVELPYDSRGRAFLTSDPFYLGLMELGQFDTNFTEVASRVVWIQKKRFDHFKIPTALGEDSVDRKPWFIYNNLFFKGVPWHSVSHRLKEAPELRTLSTKAVFAWQALYASDYVEKLMTAIRADKPSKFGFYAGIYEKSQKTNRSLNANTNAVILESLWYKQRGFKSFLSSDLSALTAEMR